MFVNFFLLSGFSIAMPNFFYVTGYLPLAIRKLVMLNSFYSYIQRSENLRMLFINDIVAMLD